MEKNLFLTGDVQVGKSTLLGRVVAALGASPRGFCTRPVEGGGLLRGFCMEALPGDGATPWIARWTPEGGPRPCLHTFEDYGVRCCRRALAAAPPLLVMDEIGFLENDAPAFRASVLACLDSPVPVLGVLSKKPQALLHALIRARGDVRVFETTRENRDDLFLRVLEATRSLLAASAGSREASA